MRAILSVCLILVAAVAAQDVAFANGGSFAQLAHRLIRVCPALCVDVGAFAVASTVIIFLDPIFVSVLSLFILL